MTNHHENNASNDGRAHGSNLTSRFGMNDNVARPQDAGNTVVGGAFGDHHTGDAYAPPNETIPGGGRDLEGRGTTGEHFGKREDVHGLAPGHQDLAAGVGAPGATGAGHLGHEQGHEHGKGALAGAGLAGAAAGAGAEHHHSHHQGHHERQEHGHGHEGGIKGVIPAGTHGFDNSSVNHHGQNDPATGVPLSGQHHGNHHGVPGLPGDELGAPAAAVGHGAHGTHGAQGERLAQNPQYGQGVGTMASQGQHGVSQDGVGPQGLGQPGLVNPSHGQQGIGEQGLGARDFAAQDFAGQNTVGQNVGGRDLGATGMAGQGVAAGQPIQAAPSAVPAVKDFPRTQGPSGMGLMGSHATPVQQGQGLTGGSTSHGGQGLAGAPSGLSSGQGMSGAGQGVMGAQAGAPGVASAGPPQVKAFPRAAGGSGWALGAQRPQ